jgi:hypothetical protein
MATTQRITPCLWFADEAEEAAGLDALRRAHDGAS